MIHSDLYRYQLDTTSKKHNCPDCGKKRFVLYLDNETNQPLDTTVGRCDRVQSCGYHFSPKEYFDSTGNKPDDWRKAPAPLPKPKPEKPGRLPFKDVQATLNRYDENQLVQWLSALPGWNPELAERTALMYYVGTGNKDLNQWINQWPIYWQIDNYNQVRSGKLIKYNPATGKRIKDDDVYSYDWVHRILIRSGKLPDDKTRWALDQCLFGLHLIDTDKNKPIAIVESEKTAIIASQFIPDFIWLSSGQLNGLNEKKLMPLKGRKVVLFPDKGKAYHDWKTKADEFSYLMKIKVSDLLELKAPAEHDGYDLADYLIQFDLSTFYGSTAYQQSHYHTEATPKAPEPLQADYPASWDDVTEPQTGTAEYFEMIRYEIADSDRPRPDLIGELDATFAKIETLFDAVL